jgi:hypothetical protein
MNKTTIKKLESKNEKEKRLNKTLDSLIQSISIHRERDVYFAIAVKQ